MKQIDRITTDCVLFIIKIRIYPFYLLNPCSIGLAFNNLRY